MTQLENLTVAIDALATQIERLERDIGEVRALLDYHGVLLSTLLAPPTEDDEWT